MPPFENYKEYDMLLAFYIVWFVSRMNEYWPVNANSRIYIGDGATIDSGTKETDRHFCHQQMVIAYGLRSH